MKIANPPICFFIVTEAAITHHTHFVLSFLHLALNNLFPIHQTPIITLLWNHFLKAWKQSDYIELISVQNVSLENQFVNISIITITKDRILFSVIVHRHIKKANISATKAFISLINRTLMVRNLEFIWNNFVFWPVLQKVFDKRKKRLQSRLNKRFENKNHLLIEHKRFRFGRWFRWLPVSLFQRRLGIEPTTTLLETWSRCRLRRHLSLFQRSSPALSLLPQAAARQEKQITAACGLWKHKTIG